MLPLSSPVLGYVFIHMVCGGVFNSAEIMTAK
jgi:hypothetical protein